MQLVARLVELGLIDAIPQTSGKTEYRITAESRIFPSADQQPARPFTAVAQAQGWAGEALEGVKAKNRRSGRKMSDAIFLAKKVSGRLKIGDKREIDRAAWRKPHGIRLTPTSRYIRDKLFPS